MDDLLVFIRFHQIRSRQNFAQLDHLHLFRPLFDDLGNFSHREDLLIHDLRRELVLHADSLVILLKDAALDLGAVLEHQDIGFDECAAAKERQKHATGST